MMLLTEPFEVSKSRLIRARKTSRTSCQRADFHEKSRWLETTREEPMIMCFRGALRCLEVAVLLGWCKEGW
jgi:hypothetical protein